MNIFKERDLSLPCPFPFILCAVSFFSFLFFFFSFTHFGTRDVWIHPSLITGEVHWEELGYLFLFFVFLHLCPLFQQISNQLLRSQTHEYINKIIKYIATTAMSQHLLNKSVNISIFSSKFQILVAVSVLETLETLILREIANKCGRCGHICLQFKTLMLRLQFKTRFSLFKNMWHINSEHDTRFLEKIKSRMTSETLKCSFLWNLSPKMLEAEYKPYWWILRLANFRVIHTSKKWWTLKWHYFKKKMKSKNFIQPQQKKG